MFWYGHRRNHVFLFTFGSLTCVNLHLLLETVGVRPRTLAESCPEVPAPCHGARPPGGSHGAPASPGAPDFTGTGAWGGRAECGARVCGLTRRRRSAPAPGLSVTRRGRPPSGRVTVQPQRRAAGPLAVPGAAHTRTLKHAHPDTRAPQNCSQENVERVTAALGSSALRRCDGRPGPGTVPMVAVLSAAGGALAP